MALIGCGGSTNFPDSVPSSSADGPAISGVSYGGHAPIQGQHVYLLQPGTTGYGSAATSLLGNNNATSGSGGFALTADVNDPNVPVGAKFETTASDGSFNFTGAYKCTVGQPVYIYAWGGNIGPTTTPNSTTFTISSIKVTPTTNGMATYAFTINSTQALAAGAAVTIAGLNDDFNNSINNPSGDDFAVLNGNQTVLASPAPTATTFSITATDDFTFEFLGFIPVNETNAGGTFGTNDIGTGGTVTATSSTTNPATNNASIALLATLGNCPSSGNFSTPGTGNGDLQFVFMNEVSTVATAYTFQPFTLATNNDAWHIGTTGGAQAQLAIANAANTAAQLYNIQGNGPSSTTADGEGHIANATTPNGNGTVPQATIDALANILAACVDSTTTSPQCTKLFNVARDNGETNGIEPVDTATAAINIARYPNGNGLANTDATFASDLFAIPTGTVPYTPALTAAPNDWTLGITYSGGSIVKTDGSSPHAIAVDFSGNIYHADFSTDTFSVLSPLGVPTTITTPTTLDGPVSIALDSNATGVSSNVWLANLNGTNVSRCPITGGTCVVASLGGLTNPQDAEIDGSGNVWVSASGTPPTRRNGITNQGIVEISSAATPGVLHTFTNANDVDGPTGLSITSGAAGDIYTADTAGVNVISQCTATGCNELTGGGNQATDDTAIDGNGDIWITNNDGTVAAIAVTGTNFNEVGNSIFTTGATTASDSVAIDGANNAWVSNSGASTVFVLTTAGVVNSTTGFKSSSALDPDGIAIDPSGNVWYDTTNGGIVELVGAGAPTVTPLSFAVANSKLGTKPK